MKTIVVYNPQKMPGELWLPVLWAQAKTYYEKHGKKNWQWWPCYADAQGDDIDSVKEILEQAQPDVFAVSLYVWNYELVNQVSAWVKQRWPKCIIISGGPHQYFKHDTNWFKKHLYFDASLPGECFGEKCIQELLDCDVLDWDQVSDVVYPKGKSRLISYSKKITSNSQRQEFDYNWSSLGSQKKELQHLINYHKSRHQRLFTYSIIETTRGCPYGCTYCDWGGGINTKVIKRDIECVTQDIDALCTFDLDFVYFADANFGIFGQRDVDIMQYLAAARKQNLQVFNIGYGGFAKTENRLQYIEQILQIDISHNLSAHDEIKISMQSLDASILKNIDRKNVSLEKQIKTYQGLQRQNALPLYVELIYGLPGMTLDKFYWELDEIGRYNLSIQWYSWQLLPQTPAYHMGYRQQYKLGTVNKSVDWNGKSDDNHSEIVVESFSYSRDDYLEMLLASSMYRLLVQGGYFKQTTSLLKSQGIGTGEIIKRVVQEFFLAGEEFSNEVVSIRHYWGKILTLPDQAAMLLPQNARTYPAHYFATRAFGDHNFTMQLASWLQKTWNVPDHVISRDVSITIHEQNVNKKVWHGWWLVDYSMGNPTSDLMDQIIAKYRGFKNSGQIARGRRRLLGILPL